jgi:acetyltransferase-like isoleucine patch superfamily enzyme
MRSARRAGGAGALGLYRLAGRAWGKSFSLMAGGAFAEFGPHTVLQPPVRLQGERRIAIGRDAFIGPNSWLQALGEGDGVGIEIGDGCSIVGGCVLSAARSIRLGRRVLFARNVYVADHAHAFEDPTTAVLDQGITKVAPVVIDDGAWLGENVFVGPGVRIGRGAVVGANAVVLRDVPDHGVAVGVPARVIRVGAAEGAAAT